MSSHGIQSKLYFVVNTDTGKFKGSWGNRHVARRDVLKTMATRTGKKDSFYEPGKMRIVEYELIPSGRWEDI